MIRINLLPYVEKKKKEDTKAELFVFAGVILIFLVLLGSLAAYMMIGIGGLESDIEKNEQQLAVLNKVVGEVETFKADKLLMEKKLSIIQKLEENRLYPVRMLDQFTSLVPVKDVWFEKIAEAGTELTIEGMARDSIAVARFMKSLETASFIKSVDLIFSKQKDLSGHKLQQFTLKCITRRSM
ncbi:MAG: PilN domain-containing protein [Syntrophales bacterium]